MFPAVEPIDRLHIFLHHFLPSVVFFNFPLVNTSSRTRRDRQQINSALGAIQVLRNAIFLQIGPHPPPRKANNIEHYTFVTLFSGKSNTPPHPHLRYVTLEWPLIRNRQTNCGKLNWPSFDAALCLLLRCHSSVT